MKRVVIFAGVLLCAVTLNSGRSQALLKEPDGTFAARLASQVSIRRDTYGIPHILAKTEEAAAFGFGYAQAEDHCLSIARRLIAARGEAAKHTGQGQEGDFLIKRFDNLGLCKKNFGQLDSLLQRIYDACVCRRRASPCIEALSRAARMDSRIRRR
ncbi:MAG TPA: penicillin acylase family protein [Pyrinomonadaceae bacterium]|nr:penicillin acylase family protein [Pyrinomonadaceae bacterium]